VAFSHVSYFEGTAYDYAVLAWPFGHSGTLGLGFSRFGASDIPLIREGEPLPEGSEYNTFSISDYVFTGAWGRPFGKLSLGISFHLLKRELDQSGWGFRADAGGRYTFLADRLAAAAFLQGWTSSAARWESGAREFSPPELKLALQGTEPFPYFYGKLHIYWQSAGIFHSENRALEWGGDPFDTTLVKGKTVGRKLWQDPFDWLSGGQLGLEFETDFGVLLRAGLQHIGTPAAWTAGAGLRPLNWLQADYAYQRHPALSAVHRVSITAFPGIFLSPPAIASPPPTPHSIPRQKRRLPPPHRPL
jgi:hypothetical protein